jgi:predicted acyl esterase
MVLTSGESRIRVRVFGEGERTPFFALEQWFRKAIADAYPGSRVVNFKQTTLPDKVTPAAEINWQRPDASGDLRLLDLYIYIEGKIAVIQSSSPLNAWAQNEATFQKLISSVKVTSQKPPGAAFPAVAGEKPGPDASKWKWQEVQIPMADGKALAASIRVPGDTTRRYPTVLIQTPYGKHWYVNAPETYLPFLSDDYAFVAVDIRGYYASAQAGERWTTTGLDGYSAVEWIAAQSWSDGKVGTWGPSALGAVQFSTAMSQPPHLVCAVPIIRNLRNDYVLYFPGGAFREAYNDTISVAVGLPKKSPTGYPTAGWDERGVAPMSASFIDIPMLLIGGWYDHHTLPDGYGIIQSYFDVQTAGGPNARGKQRLLIGPWTHTDYDKLDQGQLQYSNAEGVAGDEAKVFFDYWLKGIDNGYSGRLPIRYYQMGMDQWLDTATWPPTSAKEVVFYLDAGGELSAEKPGMSSPDVFRADPNDPVPTIGGPEVCYRGGSIACGPRDQREFVENRDDVLVYTTDVLQNDIKVTGEIQVKLFVSSDRRDTDFVVRLCDVYPDGRSMLVTDGIRRMRFRNSYIEEELMEPGKIYTVTIELPNTALTFLKGHKVRISVSSSNYPRFDVNPNNGGRLYQDVEKLVATNTVYHDAGHLSTLVFMPGRSGGK